jgi:hypothetical protein
MERYCQNPLCENEATKTVPVSVDKPADQKRALCPVCEEVYTWGVQHGCFTVVPKRVWVLQVNDAGTTVHAGVFRTKRSAVRDLAAYLQTQEGYCGSRDLPSICDWMAERNEHLGADIFPASVDLS